MDGKRKKEGRWLKHLETGERETWRKIKGRKKNIKGRKTICIGWQEEEREGTGNRMKERR